MLLVSACSGGNSADIENTAPSSESAAEEVVESESANEPAVEEESSQTEEAAEDTASETTSTEVVESPSEAVEAVETDNSGVEVVEAESEVEAEPMADIGPPPEFTPNLKATDPTTVVLGNGRPQVVEFFAFW